MLSIYNASARSFLLTDEQYVILKYNQLIEGKLCHSLYQQKHQNFQDV